jgi:hypothetical protein
MSKMSHLEIYSLLQKSNCRQCELPTCLAFAAAVMRGEKRPGLCPHLESSVIETIEARLEKRAPTVGEDREETLRRLKGMMKSFDFQDAARRLGASPSGDALEVRCLGKGFSVDSKGNVKSDCHQTPWLIIPLLDYILHGAGRDPSGTWVLFRELDGGADWHRLFGQRCEKPWKRLVDAHTDLFEDLLDLFDGTYASDDSAASVSIILRPLPKLPLLIRYWRNEGDFDSALSLFFDAAAVENLRIESIYTLCVGLLTMFERIVMTHGKRA